MCSLTSEVSRDTENLEICEMTRTSTLKKKKIPQLDWEIFQRD